MGTEAVSGGCMCVQGTNQNDACVGVILHDSDPFTNTFCDFYRTPMRCTGKVLSALVCIWETWGSEWLLCRPMGTPGLTQSSTSYLVVNFKFLYHPQLHEHPKSSCDHGIDVERKVIEMYVIDGKFRHQRDVGCLQKQKT